MRTKKGILVLGVIVAMVLTVSSFALGLEKVLFVVPRPSVDVFDDVALVVASKMGYFAEEGIEVEWKGSAGGTDCTKLVATGAAQFGYPSEGVMLWSVVEGMDIMNVYQVDQINVFNFGMKPGSGIKEIKDLKGKTIALGSMAWKPICDPIL
ncbi:MAG: ABC transporter substrate-binding protein, partial [Candidatus Atribacteria bacterium]|nr:ABC transporter substrate-binding protein [Candidatus Atribacteria bacterium]